MSSKKSAVDQAREDVCAAYSKNAFGGAGMYIRFTRDERALADSFDVSAALAKARRERAEFFAKQEQEALDKELGGKKVGPEPSEGGELAGPRL